MYKSYDNNICQHSIISNVKLKKTLASSLIAILLVSSLSSMQASAHSGHPNLFVSAENALFENHFAGSMVVEVVIRDSDISDTDEGKGEPDVTINGKDLRMVQGSDGNWYAYFANLQQAKQADQIASTGMAGESLDFGVFCDSSTDSSVLGTSFSDTEGVAIPDDNGIAGATDGTAPFTACTGVLGAPSSQNNVLRSTRSLNLNSVLPPGQIGINPNAWPLIQLFSFSNNVVIVYNRGGGSQQVELDYSDIPNISLKLDRNAYPNGAEVFAIINDMQLNQDPTSVDSWTFRIDSNRAAFYQAFTESGSSSGNGGPGLVNLNPFLGILGFEKNGNLGINLGPVVELRTNQHQPTASVTTGPVTYTNIVTFVETEPNSGIFKSFDYSDRSTIGVSRNALRGQSGSIEYNSQAVSIVSGTSTASLSLGVQTGFSPGKKVPITLVDNDQNLNQGAREDLDIFRSTAIIPTLQIGNPITLEKTSSVTFYPQADSFVGGTLFSSTVPDKNSDRLLISATSSPDMTFEKVTVDLGITASTLQSLFIDVPAHGGTNWINYDLRSFEQQLGIASFSDTSMILHFGALGSSQIQIAGAGQISSAKGLVQISDTAIDAINAVSPSSPVFLEINFDTSNNNMGVGTVSIEQETQPIVFDLFSFGEKNSKRINNAIYRAELEETSSNSGTFAGTIEYAVANQVNQFDPSLIRSLRTSGNEIKFLVNDRLVDEKGINLAYSDRAKVGVVIEVSSKTDITTHSGTVTLEKQSYRFGQPVVIILTDPDLNTKHDVVDIYNVIDSPGSPADDTVGDSNENILLEIRIKGFRYQRCTISGVQYGGLASTGFSLVETGPATGVFTGSFKMPSQICSEDRTQLISPAGGSIEASYFDFRDSSGQQREIGITFTKEVPSPQQNIPKVEEATITTKPTEIRDTFNRQISQKSAVGQKLSFITEISSQEQKPQSYSYIIQVKDETGQIVDLRWIDGKIYSATKKAAEISWKPSTPGKYMIEIFLWDGINSAVPLAKKMEYSLNIEAR
jgi:hypothetical protein